MYEGRTERRERVQRAYSGVRVGKGEGGWEAEEVLVVRCVDRRVGEGRRKWVRWARRGRRVVCGPGKGEGGGRRVSKARIGENRGDRGGQIGKNETDGPQVAIGSASN